MLEKTFHVKSYDVYPNSTLKPSALQRYMQQFAREDCDKMGWTYNDMRAVNMVFVLTKMGIKVNAPVSAYDELKVRTYNNRIKGIVFTREYEFYRDGVEIIHATTEWVIINYDDRKLVRPSAFPFAIPEANLDCASVSLPRSILGDEDFEEVGTRPVFLSDLDENDHLNNCIYSDIIMDYNPDYDRKSQYFNELYIIFRHEAKFDDVLNLKAAYKNNGHLVYHVSNETTQTPCFEAEIAFGKIQRD